MEKEAITIKKVAKMAGVSTATVSRYLNGTREFPKETKSLIQYAIDELGYVPNENARSLKHNRTKVIGVIIPDMVVYSYIVQEIEKNLYEYGYSVIVANSSFDKEKEAVLLRNLLRQRVDGILIASCGSNSSILKTFWKQGVPIVLFDRFLEDLPDMPYVLEKGKECVRKLVEFTISQGHRNIAYMKGPQNEYVSEERYLEFLKVLEENNIIPLQEYHYSNVVSKESLTKVSTDILNNIDKISVVITTNSRQIKTLFMEAHKRGMSIPQDISVTGFGLEEYKSLFPIPVTCIIQNHEAIGKACSEAILRMVEKKEWTIEERTINSEFFIGESVKRIIGNNPKKEEI